jgi:hypothetical protein
MERPLWVVLALVTSNATFKGAAIKQLGVASYISSIDKKRRINHRERGELRQTKI